MGGNRTDAISTRDLEVLEFVARFGIVPRTAASHWAQTKRAATLKRERRLRLAGLLTVDPGIGDTGRLLLATRQGLTATGRTDLRPAQLSAARARHESIVATLAARLERTGERLLSEREIIARERAVGARHLSAALPNGRYHRADLLRLTGRRGAAGLPTYEAIEVAHRQSRSPPRRAPPRLAPRRRPEAPRPRPLPLLPPDQALRGALGSANPRHPGRGPPLMTIHPEQ